VNQCSNIWDNNGQFKFPSGVAVTNDGRILVTDYNHRVQAFTSDGQFLFSFGSQGSEPGFFRYPFGIVVDEKTGFIFVADRGNERVQIFSSEGKFQHSIQVEGEPIGLVIDREQRLIVTCIYGCISIL